MRCIGRQRPAATSDVEQFDFEHERRVRRDHAACAARAVAELRRNRQATHAADLHALHAFVPALDDHAAAEHERERVVAVLARIEFLTVGQPARVVDADGLAGLRFRAGAFGQVFVFEARFGRDDRHDFS